MKKFFLLLAFVLVSCSNDEPTTHTVVAPNPVAPNPVAPAPVVHECTLNYVFEQRLVVYNGRAEIISDSGWLLVQDLGFYSYVCTDNGKIIDKGDVYLNNMTRVFKRFRVYL